MEASVVESKVWLISGEQLANTPTVWEFVKQGLEKVKSKIGPRSKWTPMHIRQSLINKASELWLVVDGGEPVGFYILSIITDPFIQVPTTLFVWVAYAVPGNWGLIERHLGDVKERARQLGLEQVELMSPRNGWLRRLDKLGFKVVERIYGLKV